MKLGRRHIPEELECSIQRFSGPDRHNCYDQPAKPCGRQTTKSAGKQDRHGRNGMKPGVVLRPEHQAYAVDRMPEALYPARD